MGYAAAIGHAVEQSELALVILEHALPKTSKDVMNVMRRICGGDAVDEGFWHGAIHCGNTGSLVRVHAPLPIFVGHELGLPSIPGSAQGKTPAEAQLVLKIRKKLVHQR
jgi:hypothetical protein